MSEDNSAQGESPNEIVLASGETVALHPAVFRHAEETLRDLR